MRHVHIFGSECYLLPPKAQRNREDKIVAHAVRGIFLGYDPYIDRYIVEDKNDQLHFGKQIRLIEELHTHRGYVPIKDFSRHDPVPPTLDAAAATRAGDGGELQETGAIDTKEEFAGAVQNSNIQAREQEKEDRFADLADSIEKLNK